MKSRHSQQINGREGETATLLSTGFVTLTLRVGGFAPRHLNRCALSLICHNVFWEKLKDEKALRRFYNL